MKKLRYLFALISLTGCAMTYAPPTLSPQVISKPVEGSSLEAVNRIQTVLVREGYQIASIDKEAGLITTAVRELRLNDTHCDCGTTMGLPYIKDNRTITRVSIGVVVVNGVAEVRAHISGEYLKGESVQSIAFDCISTGYLEKQILDQL